MSQVYNPEADVVAEIEKLEIDARRIHQKIAHVHNLEDRHSMNKLLLELRDRILFLRRKLV